MRYPLYILVLVLVLAITTACKKSKKTGPAPDSIELHQEGGFAGMANIYLLTSGELKKFRYTDTVVLPQDKYDAVKHLLTIPEKMYKDYKQGLRDPGNFADYIQQYIIVKKDGQTYTWDFTEYTGNDVPGYAKAYADEVYKALNLLQ